MTKEEFNLSEKIIDQNNFEKAMGVWGKIKVPDIKEFIKRLKEEMFEKEMYKKCAICGNMGKINHKFKGKFIAKLKSLAGKELSG